MKIQTRLTTKFLPWFKTRWLLLFSFLTATVFLGLCSKSSPLYPMNDWVDVHCFLTLGKGMLHGMVPYVDLYEQKGPVLYFVYAIVALFSQKSMFGQFLLEIITFGLFLYYSAKIAEIYLGKSRYLYAIILILAAVIPTTAAFSHGGSVEQSCLFLFAYGLYTVLKACHENRGLTFHEAFVNGLFAGAALWIKYTMLGFYIGLALFVLIWYLGWVRNFKKLLATIGQFLLGAAAVSAVVFAYFLIVGGLEELFTCYFYNNLFLYKEESEFSKAELIYTYFSYAMETNLVFPRFLLAGVFFLVAQVYKAPRDLMAGVLTFLGLTITTYLGKGYVYYSLVLSAFSVFGLVGIARLLQLLRVSKGLLWLTAGSKAVNGTLIGLFFVLSMLYANNHCQNKYLMHYEKADLPQYQFAEIINETGDASILNFGFLDGGFYYAADTLPTCPFFCTFNINAPGMWDTQYDYINNGKVDFIITRDYLLENYPVNSFKFELVSTATFYFEGTDYPYYLYRLKE